MDKVFDWCVALLEFLAPRLGMTYKELNVWLFVIVMLGIILILAVLCVRYPPYIESLFGLLADPR